MQSKANTIRTGQGRGHLPSQRSNHIPNDPQLRNQPSYQLQPHQIMMPGQRPHYMPTHSVAMVQRSMRPNRAMYSSSPQAQSPIHGGYLPQQNMPFPVVGQEQYVMRPAYLPSVSQYPLQASNAPFQPAQFLPQHQQSFYQGVPQVYYQYANQQLQPQQQPNQTPNPTVQANNINKPKAKKSSSKIIIRDPKRSNIDVTDEILSHKSTVNGRSGGTPPLTNSTAQTESSAIQALFAAQVAAAAGDRSKNVNEKKAAEKDKYNKEHPARTTDQTEEGKAAKTDGAHESKQENGSIGNDARQVHVNRTEIPQKVNSLPDQDRTDISKNTTDEMQLQLDEVNKEKLLMTMNSEKGEQCELPKVVLMRPDRENTVKNQNGTSEGNEKATEVGVMTEKGSESTFEAKQVNDIVPSLLEESYIDDGTIRDKSLNDAQNVDKEEKLDDIEQQGNIISVEPEIKTDAMPSDINEVASSEAELPTQEDKTLSQGQVMTTIETPKEPALQELSKDQEKSEKEIPQVNKPQLAPQGDKEQASKLEEHNQQPQPNKEKQEVNKQEQEVNKLQQEVNKEQQEVNKQQQEAKQQQEVNKEQQEVNKEQQEVNEEQQAVNKEQQEVNKEQQEVNKKQQEVNKEQQEVNKEQQEVNKEQQEVNKEQQEVNKQQQEVNKQEEEVNKQQQQPIDKQQQPVGKQQMKQDNPKPQDKLSQQLPKVAEPPRKKSSKQRLKDLKNKETGGDLMDAYTDKPPPREPVVEETVKPVEIVPEQSDKPLEEDLSWEDKEEKIGDEIKVEKENEAEPAIPVEQTKRKYERDFLLQFQFMQVCTEKPAGLPDIEVVLDAPVPPAKGGGSQRGGPDFLPSFARQKSLGGGGRRDSRGKPQPRKIIAAAPQPPVVLKQSENRWQRPQEKEQELSEEEKKTAELYRHVVAILNKLTPQKFKTLVEQIMALNIDTPERLEGVIDRIFEKAIGEPVFSVAYANMCRCLFTIKVPDAEGKEVSFRKLLLNRCQKEFEKEKEDEQALLEKHNQLEGLSEEEIKVKKEEMDEALGKNKRRMLGNIKFIGELFKLKLLTENIMHDCIFKLLRAGDEESLESMCKLLFTIGKDLDSEKAKPRIEQYFDQIKKIIVAKKVSSRVTFMLRDVVELRQKKWIPRREGENNPKTIDQIHKEAQMEKIQEQKIAASLPAKDNKQKKGGSGGGRDSPKPVANDGWITTGKGGKSLSFDPSKLKSIGKRTNNEEISLGPSSRFGQWGRGSSAGLNNSSQEQEPQANRYSALRDTDIPPSNKPYDPRKSSSTGARPPSAGSRGGDKRQTKSDRDSALEAVRALTKPQSEKPPNEKPQVVQPSANSQEKQEVKVSKEPKVPIKEPLSEEELMKKTTALIDEYANIQDLQEAIACFTDLHSPSLHHLFILTAVEHTYEMSPKDRRLTGKLFAELLARNKLTREQLTKGFNSVLEVAPDNAIDYPMLWKYLAEIITAVILGDQFTLCHLKPLIFEHLKPCGKAAVVLAEILLTTKDSASESKAVQVWTDLAISWSEVLPERQSEEDFLSRKNLNFLPKENDELLKLLRTDQLKNDIVFAHIEKKFKEEKRKESQFINYLVTAVAESCIINKDKEAGPECCKEKLKARKDILRKYLDANSTLELEALFVLQKIYDKYNKSAAMLSQFFNTLYDEEVITEEAFMRWKQNEDPMRQEAKGPALQATSSFFEWLQSATVENDN